MCRFPGGPGNFSVLNPAARNARTTVTTKTYILYPKSTIRLSKFYMVRLRIIIEENVKRFTFSANSSIGIETVSIKKPNYQKLFKEGFIFIP
jgi:hypothetical protein